MTGDPAAVSATRSQVFGLVAVPLWLASFSWVPFAMNDEDLPTILGPMIPVFELSGLVLAIVAIVLGRRATREATNDRVRVRARRGTLVGIVVVSLGVALNILGLMLAS